MKRLVQHMHWTWEFFVFVPLIVLLIGLTVMLVHGGIVQVPYANTATLAILDALMFATAACTFGTAVYTIRSMFTQICADDEGLSLLRFGKKRMTIRWDEVTEAGVARLDTMQGGLQRMYFSRVPLTDEQRNDLDRARGDVVCFNRLSPELIDFIERRCPVPLSDELRAAAAVGRPVWRRVTQR